MADLAAGTPVGAGYTLGTVIGRGAMGTVYGGTDRSGRPVAIKILSADLAHDPDSVSRLINEKALLVRLRGTNVVEVRDLVVEGDLLAIVMGLVTGGSLRDMMDRNGNRLPEAEALDVACDVLAGLEAAHAIGIVHRDVKPANVLLDVEGSSRQALVSDFGIAGIAGSSPHTRMTSVVVTPAYMAPELADDAPATPAVDVYATGILLYEMIAGSVPFSANSVLAMIKKHAVEVPTRPDGMSENTWAAVIAMLAKEPDARPTAALALSSLVAIRQLPQIRSTTTTKLETHDVERTTHSIQDGQPSPPGKFEADPEATILKSDLNVGEVAETSLAIGGSGIRQDSELGLEVRPASADDSLAMAEDYGTDLSQEVGRYPSSEDGGPPSGAATSPRRRALVAAAAISFVTVVGIILGLTVFSGNSLRSRVHTPATASSPGTTSPPPESLYSPSVAVIPASDVPSLAQPLSMGYRYVLPSSPGLERYQRVSAADIEAGRGAISPDTSGNVTLKCIFWSTSIQGSGPELVTVNLGSNNVTWGPDGSSQQFVDPGFSAGISGMRVGGQRQVVVPPTDMSDALQTITGRSSYPVIFICDRLP